MHAVKPSPGLLPRSLARLRRIGPFTTLVLLSLPLGAAAANAPDAAAPTASAGGTAGHPFCGQTLATSAWGRIGTPFGSPEARDFTVAAGPWVGAVADRGEGPVTSVSTAYFSGEFWPPDPAALAPGLPPEWDLLQVAYADTGPPFAPEDHVPLGLFVVQTSVSVPGASFGYVKVEYDVKNISHEWQPPGWDLEDVYFGILADPDIGRTDATSPWTDDQVAFKGGPEGANARIRRMPDGIGYAFDEPNDGDDDVDAAVGIGFLGRDVHAFRWWSGGLEDPRTDEARYAFLSGFGGPPIDPPTTRPNDYRMVVSTGPVDRIAPGESRRFTVVFLCGDVSIVPPAELALAQRDAARASASLSSVRVSSNPVRLTASATFLGLPEAATLGIYSVEGRLLTTLDARAGEATWDLRGGAGRRVPAGVYFWRAATAREARTGRLVVLR